MFLYFKQKLFAQITKCFVLGNNCRVFSRTRASTDYWLDRETGQTERLVRQRRLIWQRDWSDREGWSVIISMRERQVIDRRHFHIRSYFSYHPISYGENGSEGPSILDKFRGDQSPIFVSRVLKSDSKKEICRCTFFLSESDSVFSPLPPTQLYIYHVTQWLTRAVTFRERQSEKWSRKEHRLNGERLAITFSPRSSLLSSFSTVFS